MRSYPQVESIFPQAVESIVDIHSISTGICVQIVGKRPSRAAEDTEVSAMDHIELWDKAKALMREELANVSYTTWIEQPLKPVYVVDDKLALEVISDFNEKTIRARYLPMITEAVSQAAGREMTIELMSVKERIEWQERQKKEEAPAMQGINMFNPKSTFDTLKSWVNTTSKMLVTKKLINEYLAEQEIPVQIITVNPAVRIEDKAHRRKTINPWERKRICFLEDKNVGDIQHGPIAAESSATLQKIAMMVKQDWILITKWSELEPFKEWTKAEANAIPVVNDPDAMFILKADGEAWNAAEDTEGTDDVPLTFLGDAVEEEDSTITDTIDGE